MTRKIRQRSTRVKAQNQNEKGLGLAESMVGVAILGVAVVTFIIALSAGSVAVREQNQQVTAQSLAQTQLEYIKSAPYNVAPYPTIAEPEGYSISVSVNSNLYADSDIQQITVTITKGEEDILSIADYKVNR